MYEERGEPASAASLATEEQRAAVQEAMWEALRRLQATGRCGDVEADVASTGEITSLRLVGGPLSSARTRLVEDALSAIREAQTAVGAQVAAAAQEVAAEVIAGERAPEGRRRG